jgi:hypothetical protein
MQISDVSGNLIFAKFSLSSHQVLNVFLNMFPIPPHFVPYALANVVPLEPIYVGQYLVLKISVFEVNTIEPWQLQH